MTSTPRLGMRRSAARARVGADYEAKRLIAALHQVTFFDAMVKAHVPAA